MAERKRRWVERSVIGFLAGLTGVMATAYILHPESFERSVRALVGAEVRCIEDTEGPFDYGVVLGAGYAADLEGSLTISAQGKWRLAGAAILFHQGKIKNIYLANGRFKDGEDPTLSREYLQEMHRLVSGGLNIPDEDIHEEFDSINTTTNFDVLMGFLEDKEDATVLVITGQEHLGGALVIGCGFDEALLEGVAAEEVVAEVPSLAEALPEPQVSAAATGKEWFRKFVTLFDPTLSVWTGAREEWAEENVVFAQEE